ncbi:MAG TPA: tRNA 4-thiouridine(8) synthase ThiI [Syntrophomonadaceae bacterium]|nr:tRNA 4-thiouridine(8) synthase ThiI [Syntrophomonadaceae bacterium]
MKAISLFSGGLDSQLAAYLIKQQGIEVIAITFTTPFFGGDDRNAAAAEKLGIEFLRIALGQEYKDVLQHPVYGYGKNMNPCIDCHAFMLKKARELMGSMGASFLVTGEVLGQRPMSQNKSALNAVDKLSGCKGLIVRPLSARLLPITIPEQEKWIDRERLLDISGRGRTRQMELANKFGIEDYPTPAGGCLLTEQNFANRLKLYLQKNPDAQLDSLQVLKYGRHFYLDDRTLLLVGRNKADNLKLLELANSGDYLIKVINYPGPVGLIPAPDTVDKELLRNAGAIVARYSDANKETLATVKISRQDNPFEQIFEVAPLPPEEVIPAI